ncbi:MAG: DUF4142 domain-containing protein [Vicinamibacterales bacterium]
MTLHRLSFGLALVGALTFAACSGAGHDAATSEPAGPLPGEATTVAPDPGFVNDVATAGATEIAASRMALDTTASADVKALAERVVRDHEQANERLRHELDDTPVAPEPSDVAVADATRPLDGLTGEAFDRAYVDMMVDDHVAAISLVESKVIGGGNAHVKDWASYTLPILRDHLRRAREVQDELSGG